MHPAILAEADAALRRRVIAGVTRDVRRAINRTSLGVYYRWVLTDRTEWTARPTGSLAVVTPRHSAPILGARPLIESLHTYRPDVEGD